MTIRSTVAGATVLAGVAAGCSAVTPSAPPDGSPGGLESVRQGNRISGRVIAISVDGLTPASVRRLGREGTPALHRMMRQGTGTLNARTLREKTRTLPNHTTMVTGRRATGPQGHGITVNDDTGRTVHHAAGHHVDSMFTVVHDRGGSTAMYVAKEKFALLDRTWNAANGGGDRVGRNDGRDKIGRYHRDDERSLVRSLVNRLRTRPDALSFVHLALPDAAGHRHGFGSPRYLTAVRRVDALVGRILRTVAARPSLRRTTTVILTSDHGGRGREHRDPTRRADFTIPFLVWGAHVTRGADLYRLNPQRQAPGRSRTDYRESQPVRNGELANLATDLLGLPRVPGSVFNAGQGLRVAAGGVA
ncbi:MAG: alkaline phosphatase family protein [Nocardioides sp.]